MKASLLLVLVCVAVLAAGARADAPGEPEALVRKVQEFAQKATAMAKTAFGTVQESEVAQQARCAPAPPPARAPGPAAPPPAGEPGRSPALSPLPLQAVAGGQRRAGEAAAGLAEGAAGGALDADTGRVALPGAGRGPAGPGSPRLPPPRCGSCNKAALKRTAVVASLGGR
ncbi:apolipoprotein C-III [Ciconia boyciana]|uniref:apolipoprotein C-III n=1 Tax=Ciconia boyciana TaxID=52775 RepID=UPI003BA1085A